MLISLALADDQQRSLFLLRQSTVARATRPERSRATTAVLLIARRPPDCRDVLAECKLLRHDDSLSTIGELRSQISSALLDRQVHDLPIIRHGGFCSKRSPLRPGAILDELHERDRPNALRVVRDRFDDEARAAVLTRQAISQHLDVLESVGLVTTSRQGRYKFHYLDASPLKAIVDRWLTTQEEGRSR